MTHEAFLYNFHQWKVLVSLERESLKEETRLDQSLSSSTSKSSCVCLQPLLYFSLSGAAAKLCHEVFVMTNICPFLKVIIHYFPPIYSPSSCNFVMLLLYFPNRMFFFVCFFYVCAKFKLFTSQSFEVCPPRSAHRAGVH